MLFLHLISFLFLIFQKQDVPSCTVHTEGTCIKVKKRGKSSKIRLFVFNTSDSADEEDNDEDSDFVVKKIVNANESSSVVQEVWFYLTNKHVIFYAAPITVHFETNKRFRKRLFLLFQQLKLDC